MKKILFVLAASLVFFPGCNKDDNKVEDTTSITLKNISGNYQYTGFTISQGQITYNAFPDLNPCQKDNVLGLKEDKTYAWPDGGTKCSTAADLTGTWDLIGTTKFKWDTDTLSIDRFDGKVFEITQPNVDLGQDVFGAGSTLYTITYKFQKQ